MADDKILTIVSTGLQISYLGAISNAVAQWIGAYRSGKGDYSVDWIPIIQFMLYLFLTTPHNFLWQELLEKTFPANPSKASSEKKDSEKKDGEKKPTPPLSITNTIIKLLLDQTVGAAFNTLLFSLFFHSIHLAAPNTPRRTNPLYALTYWTTPGNVNFAQVDFAHVWDLALNDFWPMMYAGWRFWPAVSAINFGLIKTVESRNLVGGVAGLIWGVYISLVVGV